MDFLLTDFGSGKDLSLGERQKYTLDRKHTPENVETPHENNLAIFCPCFRVGVGQQRRPQAEMLDFSLYIWGYINMSRGSTSSSQVSICGRPALNMTHRYLDRQLKVSGDNLLLHVCRTNDYQWDAAFPPWWQLPTSGLLCRAGWHQRGHTWYSVLLLNANFGLMLMKKTCVYPEMKPGNQDVCSPDRIC